MTDTLENNESVMILSEGFLTLLIVNELLIQEIDRVFSEVDSVANSQMLHDLRVDLHSCNLPEVKPVPVHHQWNQHPRRPSKNHK